MAIFSLNHKSIGKTTHKEGRAGASIRYISRASANPVIISNHIPNNPKSAKRWIDEQESKDRKNARVADTLMIALPLELDRQQRKELLEEYLTTITGDQVPYFAAIHQEGDDIHNPHAHVLIRDRSILNARRVLKTSEKGSTERFREEWAEIANKWLEQENAATIDHRSYKELGIDKEAEAHRGWKNHSEDIPNFRKKILQESLRKKEYNKNIKNQML